MRRLPFVFPLAFIAALGCGSISNRDNPSIATISGQLGAPTPAGARVALVWHAPKGGGWVVSNEADIIGGSYSMNLTAPPADNLFFDPSQALSGRSGGGYGGSSGTGGEPPTVGTSDPAPAPPPGASQLTPKDVVSGSIATPLTVAVAGFVLYVDTNGNGHLDISGDTGVSSDQIIGGSSDILLTYLRDGSNLDFEKLRDQNNQLPSRGYNLFLASNNRNAWIPLSDADLTLGDNSLPGPVCYAEGEVNDVTLDSPPPVPKTDPALPSGGSSGGSGSAGGSGPDSPVPPPSGPYPTPGDPNLFCSPDGRSWSYSSCGPVPPPPPPPPPGLCTKYIGYGDTMMPCAGYGSAIPDGAPIPDGWPCPVAGATDGGIGLDSSVPPPPPPTDGGKGP